MKDLTLSQELQTYIDSLDHSRSLDERKEAERWQPLLDAIVEITIQGREALFKHNAELVNVTEALISQSAELTAGFLDTYYTRQALDSISDRVRRTLELSRMEGAKPSKITNGYIQEAARSYIAGLPQACVALCRAAMEQALKEGIGYQGTGTFIKMEDLLDEAETAKVLDHATRKMAREVASAADDVLHEKPASLQQAFETLVKMRGIIQHVYGED